MIRIFDDHVCETNKKALQKQYLIIGLSFAFALLFTILFITLRNVMNRQLALALGIIFSSIGLIIGFYTLFAGVLALKHHERLVRKFLNNELRILTGKVSRISDEVEYHHGEPFYVLSIVSENITYDLYFWAKTNADRKSVV